MYAKSDEEADRQGHTQRTHTHTHTPYTHAALLGLL